MPYQTTEMDKIAAEILGLDKWTYEDYLKLLELDKLSQQRQDEAAAKGDVEALSKIAANGVMNISLKIGHLNAIHPDWFEKHFPELAAQNEKEKITGVPHKVSKLTQQFQEIIRQKTQQNMQELNSLVSSNNELKELNKVHKLISIEHINHMYKYESLNDMYKSIEEATGCYPKVTCALLILWSKVAEIERMRDYKNTSWFNLDASIVLLDKMKNESISLERICYVTLL